MRRGIGILAVAALLAGGVIAPSRAAATPQEYRTPLFVYLHIIRPVEDQAEQALDAGLKAEAYTLYLRTLRGYQALDNSVPDWSRVQPAGLQGLVQAGLAQAERKVQELRPAAEKENAFLHKLQQPVNVNFDGQNIRDVCKLLTKLTDVNIILDSDLFPLGGPDPRVTLRVDRGVPLLEVIQLIVQQKGLAYSIEEDHVYISTRVEIDEIVGFPHKPWFAPRP